MNILFVCKYNRFRSRIAEAYFKKINKNKSIKADSAGIIKGQPVNRNEFNAVKKFGIDINGTPKGLSDKLLINQDIIVIVADDIPKYLFDRKKYTKRIFCWNVQDSTENEKRKMKSITEKIIKKVDLFVKQLEKQK